MAVKASNQIDLIDLTDGYSVILTSDSHTFIGTTSGVSSTQTATTQVMAFRVTTRLPVRSERLPDLPGWVECGQRRPIARTDNHFHGDFGVDDQRNCDDPGYDWRPDYA